MKGSKNYYIIVNNVNENKDDDGEKYYTFLTIKGESAATGSTFMGKV